MDEILLTTGESARELGLSPDSVRRFEDEGLLPAAFKTRGGVRLFRKSDVENLRQKRAGQARERETETVTA